MPFCRKYFDATENDEIQQQHRHRQFKLSTSLNAPNYEHSEPIAHYCADNCQCPGGI